VSKDTRKFADAMAARARTELEAADEAEPRVSALAALTDQERAELAETMDKKDVVRRFVDLADLLIDLANGDKRLVTGDTLDERAAQYQALVLHVRGLWQDAASMFAAGRFATATFLAIACMEEVGKAGVAKLQMLLHDHPLVGTADRRRALYSHQQKHLLVAGQGALVNRRLDRLLGLDRIAQFLDDVEAGRIETLRQAALYADHDGDEPLLPEKLILREEALFYVTLAGEVMAEVLGAAPELWRELLDEVVAFERDQGNALPEER
jgi:AbiV family abortive infection protein